MQRTGTFSCLHNNKGFTLTEIVIVAAIFSVILIITGKFFKDYAMINTKYSSTQAIREVRDSFAYALMSISSWEASFQHAVNSSRFTCLNDPSENCNGDGGTFVPVQSDGTLFEFQLRGSGATRQYNPVANNNHGFDLNGEFCENYPNDTCPFRFEFVWTPMCPSSGTCTLPSSQIDIQAQTSMTAARGWLPVNTTALGKTLFHRGKTIEVNVGACPLGQFVTGINVVDGVASSICTPW